MSRISGAPLAIGAPAAIGLADRRRSLPPCGATRIPKPEVLTKCTETMPAAATCSGHAPTEMPGVADGDDGNAVQASPLDAKRHGLPGDDLPIAEIAVDGENSTALVNDSRVPVRMHETAPLPIQILGDADDALGFVANQIGLDEMIGERLRLQGLRTRGSKDRGDDAPKRGGFDRRAHAIQSPATILRAVIISFDARAKDLKWLVSRWA